MAKTRMAVLALLATAALILPGFVSAKGAGPQESVYIPKDEIVEGSLYSAGASITIEGTVKGDVVCAAQSLVINGRVDGDVICAGQSITINGPVGGSVRVAGNTIILNGAIARTAMAAGANVTISPQANIGWDALIASAFPEIRGNIKRDLYGAGSFFTLAGPVNRHVLLYMDDRQMPEDRSALTINKEASIGGNLTYTAMRDAQIENAEVIKGSVERKNLEWKNRGEAKDVAGAWAWFNLIGIFSALVVGLLLVSWLPKPIHDITDGMLTKPLPSLGWGILVLILIPIASLLILFTVIGIPLSILSIGTLLLLVYPSVILSGIAIGRKLNNALPFMHKWHNSLMAAMIVGIIVSRLIFSIPVLGWFLCFLALLWGLGGIWRYSQAKS